MLVLSLLVLPPAVGNAQSQEHREIIEEVEVKWWLVPVFERGRPATGPQWGNAVYH